MSAFEKMALAKAGRKVENSCPLPATNRDCHSYKTCNPRFAPEYRLVCPAGTAVRIGREPISPATALPQGGTAPRTWRGGLLFAKGDFDVRMVDSHPGHPR